MQLSFTVWIFSYKTYGLWGILFMESQNHKKIGLRETRHAIPAPAHTCACSVASVSTLHMLIHGFSHAFNIHFS